MNWNCILERVSQTESTNEDLMARWRAGELIDPVSRLARHQTKGKGRAGRRWFANPQSSLCFSLAYPFARDSQGLHGLSLVCGLAAIKGIANSLQLPEEKLHSLGVGLKWPNDLLIHGKKLGGLLIEGGKLASSSPTEKIWMIIGVGINLEHSTEIEQSSQIPIAALAQCNTKQVRIEADLVWLNLLDALGNYLDVFNREGFAPFQSEWKNWDAYQNQAVEITEFGKTQYSGIALGVSQEGALLLEEYPGSPAKVIYAGDLSLKKRS